MKDFALNNQHDLDLTGDLDFTTGFDAVVQAVRVRLLLFAGEYFLDTGVGIPYRDVVLVKNPNLEEIRAVFRAEINDVDGINRVESIDVDFDNQNRSLSIEFTALIDDDAQDQTVSTDVALDIGLDDGTSLLLFDYQPSIRT